MNTRVSIYPMPKQYTKFGRIKREGQGGIYHTRTIHTVVEEDEKKKKSMKKL